MPPLESLRRRSSFTLDQQIDRARLDRAEQAARPRAPSLHHLVGTAQSERGDLLPLPTDGRLSAHFEDRAVERSNKRSLRVFVPHQSLAVVPQRGGAHARDPPDRSVFPDAVRKGKLLRRLLRTVCVIAFPIGFVLVCRFFFKLSCFDSCELVLAFFVSVFQSKNNPQ